MLRYFVMYLKVRNKVYLNLNEMRSLKKLDMIYNDSIITLTYKILYLENVIGSNL
jgi:hypothetical protein